MTPSPRAAPAPSAPAVPAEDGVDRLVRWLRMTLGLCFLGALLLSHRGWLSSGRAYPLVPVIDGLPQPPFPVDWMIFAAMAVALLGMSFARRPRPYLVAVLAITGVWVILDQNRWQPYLLAYVAGTACLLVGEMPGVRAPGAPPARWHMAPFQLALAATWAYAGLHKLNVTNMEQYFPKLMAPMLIGFGVAPGEVARLLWWPALVLAVMEMAAGLALLWPRTRRVGVVWLTLMHAFLLLLLGPLGYSMNRVVWPWNVVAIAALWLLFWPRSASDRFDGFVRAWWGRLRGRGGEAAPRPLRLAWWGAVLFFVLLPVLSFWQRWDALLSAHLYSGKERSVFIEYAPERPPALPAVAVHRQRRPGQVSLINWSLRELNLYPVLEPRVARRIGREIARRSPGVDVRLVIAEPPEILTGERRFRTFVFRGPQKVPVELPAPVRETRSVQ